MLRCRCGRVSTKESAFRQHQRSCIVAQAGEEVRPFCVLCGEQVENVSALGAHMRICTEVPHRSTLIVRARESLHKLMKTASLYTIARKARTFELRLQDILDEDDASPTREEVQALEKLAENPSYVNPPSPQAPL